MTRTRRIGLHLARLAVGVVLVCVWCSVAVHLFDVLNKWVAAAIITIGGQMLFRLGDLLVDWYFMRQTSVPASED
jgi:hypothetical protein